MQFEQALEEVGQYGRAPTLRFRHAKPRQDQVCYRYSRAVNTLQHEIYCPDCRNNDQAGGQSTSRTLPTRYRKSLKSHLQHCSAYRAAPPGPTTPLEISSGPASETKPVLSYGHFRSPFLLRWQQEIGSRRSLFYVENRI